MGETNLVLTVGHRGHSTIETTKVRQRYNFVICLAQCPSYDNRAHIKTTRLLISLIAHLILLPAGRRDIQALRVKCSNMEQDCKWEGTVGTLDKHLAECEFALVPCPKECKDDSGKVKHFIKKQVKKHLRRACPNRDYTCKHCGKKGTYAEHEITRVHDEVCDMKLLPCPNECGATIPRKNVDEHVQNECVYTVIPCKFQNIGCKIEMKREKMAAHENDDKLHLDMALNAVVKLQDANTKLEENNRTLKKGETVTFALQNYQNKKKWATSPSFYTHPNGYHMTLTVFANGNGDGEGTHVSVYVPILEGKFDKGLKWPFVGEVTVTLLNQLEDKNHYTRTIALEDAHNARVGNTLGYHKYIPYSALAHDAGKNTQYLKDDTLYFRVSAKVADHKPWLECSTN